MSYAITLKALKHARSLSQETNAFTATVCVNGKPQFYAENQGHGGATNIRRMPEATLTFDEVDVWLKANHPPVDLGNDLKTDYDFEWVINALVTDDLIAKEVSRKLKATVVYTLKGKSGVYAQPIAKIDSARKHPDVDKILNDLPMADALEIWRKHP